MVTSCINIHNDNNNNNNTLVVPLVFKNTLFHTAYSAICSSDTTSLSRTDISEATQIESRTLRRRTITF